LDLSGDITGIEGDVKEIINILKGEQ